MKEDRRVQQGFFSLSAHKPAALLSPFFCYSHQTGVEDQIRMMSAHSGLTELPQEDVGDPDDIRKHHNLGQPQQDVGEILQRIMAITDESLNEAQAR